LIDAFVEAEKNQIAHCGKLKISLRKIHQDAAIFLVTKEEKVVWQSKINLEIIRNSDMLKEHIPDIPIPHREKKEMYQKKQQVADLRLGMKGVDVTAKIIEIPPATQVVTRWGSDACVSNAVITDGTGSIRLSLWNTQIDKVRVGDEIKVENGYVANFTGQPQLRIGRKGTLSVINELAS
jgi:replication factor A1